MIEIRSKKLNCDLIFYTDTESIRIDLSELSTKWEGWKVDPKIIEELFTAAFEASRFNKTPDVVTMKNLFDTYLDSMEQQELIDLLSTNRP